MIAICQRVAADGFELGAAESETVAAIDEGGDVGEFAGGGVVESGAEAGYAAVVKGDRTADRRI
ncbi:hypothetical protein [Microcoleus sp. bin38.metabat.b11b12b14.051]|uniref:hypothetical protein n=1 Tax=Microcoleus sp. bin38.metabat.b11b12b14.051 TaxID=2742709 RepID=UPI0025D12E65|nr:hypothetical protein [Microcoleus sp. bin38.metabat.b11b12b14.051]